MKSIQRAKAKAAVSTTQRLDISFKMIIRCVMCDLLFSVWPRGVNLGSADSEKGMRGKLHFRYIRPTAGAGLKS